MPSKLAQVAPRIARAVEAERAHAMRCLKRCSCGFGWRVVGREYQYGCIERLEWAQASRDHWERDRWEKVRDA